MSMDLEVWSSKPFDIESILNENKDWKKYTDEWAYEGDGWQVIVNLDKSEDAPESVYPIVSSPNYVGYISLEPIGANSEGYIFFEKTVRSLAKVSNGAWVDPYGDAFKSSEGSFE